MYHEFEISGKPYRSTKLNAFQQFHLARKLGPIIAKLGPQIAKRETNNMMDFLEPAVDALAEMSEEDCNFILHTCLAVVQRKITDSVWQPVWNASAKRLQYEDIDLMAMVQIAMHVIGDNLGNFISTPTSNTPLPQAG